MKIYSMTATFGKLNHQTLTLQPGLNVIEAPNEWGKSTWCAFLIDMLYGIDARAKTTKTALADKEHYAPWSGALMEGRMDISWNGRDITIERRTKGRLIFGDFNAYETATGIPVPELDSSNCGQMLLGVERSVFTRAGFLRLADLPVTQDDALRRRLNNLVSTGDESGAGDKLGDKLKELKNKCQYHKSGLIPQAEEQRDVLEQQIRDLQELGSQTQHLQERQTELARWIERLQNHKTALDYEAAQEDAAQVYDAAKATKEAQTQAQRLTELCKQLPDAETARQKAQKAQKLQDQWMAVQMENEMLPREPEQPAAPECFRGMGPDEAIARAKTDTNEIAVLENRKKKNSVLLWIYAVFAVLALGTATVLAFAVKLVGTVAVAAAGAAVVVAGAAVAVVNFQRAKHIAASVQKLYDAYPGMSPDKWISAAENYQKSQAEYAEKLKSYKSLRGDLDSRRAELDREIETFTGGKGLQETLNHWNSVQAAWGHFADASRDLQKAQSHERAVKSMAKTAEAPKCPDTLKYSRSETDTLIANAVREQNQNQLRMGQFQGQAEACGRENDLRERLKQVRLRLENLEDTNFALELAQKALSTATSQLQRRFAPRISKRAQELFAKLTDGRYQKITLGEDLNLSARAEGEDTLRTSLWRSEGTVDQLYLALRLAVAEELTPDAPLVLDDALARFDDERLTAALKILQETAESRQVILFSCQSREKKLQGEMI